MGRPGEVITLQFGGYANWTGAHFWNFQVRREREPSGRSNRVSSSHSRRHARSRHRRSLDHRHNAHASLPPPNRTKTRRMSPSAWPRAKTTRLPARSATWTHPCCTASARRAAARPRTRRGWFSSSAAARWAAHQAPGTCTATSQEPTAARSRPSSPGTVPRRSWSSPRRARAASCGSSRRTRRRRRRRTTTTTNAATIRARRMTFRPPTTPTRPTTLCRTRAR